MIVPIAIGATIGMLYAIYALFFYLNTHLCGTYNNFQSEYQLYTTYPILWRIQREVQC